jgi:hypothetical protein
MKQELTLSRLHLTNILKNMKMHIMHDIIEIEEVEELICKHFTCFALVI